MTDRELLELAAKAAGIALEWNDADAAGYYGSWRGLPQWEQWNPLTDDGDALRLAVKLRMVIDISDEHALASPQESSGAPECVFFGKAQVGHAIHDAESATRRAIVRAAAEIGRQHD